MQDVVGHGIAGRGKGRVTGHAQVTTIFSMPARGGIGHGGARHRWARLDMVWHGMAGHDKGPRSGGHEAHRTVIFSMPAHDEVGHGGARPDSAWRGMAWRGKGRATGHVQVALTNSRRRRHAAKRTNNLSTSDN
jgi:hypothetical protein